MKTFAVLALAAAVAVSAMEPSRTVLHHRVNHPHDWKKLGRADGEAAMRFHIAIKHDKAQVAQLEAKIMDIANPDSPNYGKWLTKEQAAQAVAPPVEHVEQVLAWARSYNVLATASADDVMVVAPVSVVEQMFNTEVFSFEHNESQAKVLAHMGAATLPGRLSAIVDFVSGLSLFPPQNLGPKKHSDFPNRKTSLADGPDYAVVPETLYKLYDVPSTPAAGTGASSGVIEFSPNGAGVLTSDLEAFKRECGGPAQDIFKKVGTFNPNSQVDVEATLDVQYINAMTEGIDLWFWTGSSWLYEFAQDFTRAGRAVPEVISISYGWAESHQCQVTEHCNQVGIDSKTYVERVNTEFAKIASTGVSIFVASGDAGAASKLNIQCNQTPSSPINPDYPVASPWVTGVGATMLTGEGSPLRGAPRACEQQGGCSDGSGTEVVCTTPRALITSGGGLSLYASQPSDPRQKKAAEHWFSIAKDIPPAQYINRNGRAYPDITALGHSFIIIDQGMAEKVDGTSASSPLTAGIFARLNSIRKSKGKPVLGFLNPLLYKIGEENPSAYNDITSGNNKCTEQSFAGSVCCQYGFEATPGFDPVSGLGSPRYKELVKLVEALP